MRWKMDWNRQYFLKSYLKGSLWLAPFFAILFFWVFARVMYFVGRMLLRFGWIDEKTSFLGLGMTGARQLLDMIATANLSFLVFTFGSLLVAIQIAGGQYTPRIIATTLLRDNRIRYIVSYLVFTWLFANRVATRMGDETVHQFNVFVAALFGMISIAVFLYLVDYAARFLRPVSIVARVAAAGLAVIDAIYPQPTRQPSDPSLGPASRQQTDAASRSAQTGGILQRLGKLGVAAVRSVYSEPTTPAPAAEPPARSAPDRIVAKAGKSGIVLAVDLPGLVEAARRANGMIEFVPQVGDFVAVDEPLFRLYGGAGAIDDRALRASVAFGIERTIEQDPTFAFRILVDIAIKALSPAINDPTTAVLSIDQLHRLLRHAGLRHLHDDNVRDRAGEVRLVLRTPNWQDFVHLACTEIRQFGVGSVQVMRRMRSMLENLLQSLPPHRHAELRQQLALLDRVVAGYYKLPEDLALARIPDPQGLGGSLDIPPATEAPTGGGDRAGTR